MTTYVLWTRTPRGPRPTLLVNRGEPRLTDHETRSVIGGPLPVFREHEEGTLDELAPLYPCPEAEEAPGAREAAPGGGEP